MSTHITLWGRKTSINVQKVVWALEEVGVAYDHVEVGGRFGGLNEPAYRAMNPNGLVPTLQDGNLTLWESHAIVRYLSAQYADGLLFPLDPAKRAIVDQWTDWTATTFQPAWIGVFWGFYRTKPTNRDVAANEKHLKESLRLFGILDARLASFPFLAGQDITYADIVAGAALYRWTTMGIEPGDFSSVAAWHKRLEQRPGYRKGIVVDYSELKDTF
jgi:glutathione S-transferase